MTQVERIEAFWPHWLSEPQRANRTSVLSTAAACGVLTARAPVCLWCGGVAAATDPLCRRCPAVLRTTRWPLKSLESIVYESVDDPLLRRLRAWKDEACRRTDALSRRFVGERGLLFAAVLSRYLEKHAHRLLPDGTVAVVAPTSTPLIQRALLLARERGWMSIETHRISVCNAHPQRSHGYERRADRRVEDYEHFVTPPSGADVLLLDDVYVSGYTMHTYARSLLQQGARSVRGLVLVRAASWRAGSRFKPTGQPWTPAGAGPAVASDVARLVGAS